MDGHVTITVRSPEGRTLGEITRGADGALAVRVIDEDGRDEVERMAAHLDRARPPRPRASCVAPGRAPAI